MVTSTVKSIKGCMLIRSKPLIWCSPRHHHSTLAINCWIWPNWIQNRRLCETLSYPEESFPLRRFSQLLLPTKIIKYLVYKVDIYPCFLNISIFQSLYWIGFLVLFVVRLLLVMDVDLTPRLAKKSYSGDGGAYYTWSSSELGMLEKAKIGAAKLALEKGGLALPSYSDSAKVAYVLQGKVQSRKISDWSAVWWFHESGLWKMQFLFPFPIRRGLFLSPHLQIWQSKEKKISYWLSICMPICLGWVGLEEMSPDLYLSPTGHTLLLIGMWHVSNCAYLYLLIIWNVKNECHLLLWFILIFYLSRRWFHCKIECMIHNMLA